MSADDHFIFPDLLSNVPKGTPAIPPSAKGKRATVEPGVEDDTKLDQLPTELSGSPRPKKTGNSPKNPKSPVLDNKELPGPFMPALQHEPNYPKSMGPGLSKSDVDSLVQPKLDAFQRDLSELYQRLTELPFTPSKPDQPNFTSSGNGNAVQILQAQLARNMEQTVELGRRLETLTRAVSTNDTGVRAFAQRSNENFASLKEGQQQLIRGWETTRGDIYQLKASMGLSNQQSGSTQAPPPAAAAPQQQTQITAPGQHPCNDPACGTCRSATYYPLGYVPGTRYGVYAAVQPDQSMQTVTKSAAIQHANAVEHVARVQNSIQQAAQAQHAAHQAAYDAAVRNVYDYYETAQPQYAQGPTPVAGPRSRGAQQNAIDAREHARVYPRGCKSSKCKICREGKGGKKSHKK